jgi:hypothetical protein
MNMMNSRHWENGGPEMDHRGIERNSPLQQERNVVRKKLVIAVVALVAGSLMLLDHEALAHADGGGGHGGRSGGGGFHGHALRGRALSHIAGGRRFDQRDQVGDPYWTPCNYDSYGTDSCE